MILMVLIMMILINMMIIMILPMMMNTKKLGGIRILFKEFDRDYYKPIRADDGFAERKIIP